MEHSILDNRELIDKIRICAFNVRKAFTPGYLESVYQNALLIELNEAGIFAEKEKQIQVTYRGRVVGDFRIDILVEKRCVLELKAVSELNVYHEMQLVNYLKSMNLEMGILINYGGEHFQFKPKFQTYDLLKKYNYIPY